MFVLISSLLEWDINLEMIEFRSEESTERYRVMFGRVLPHVIQLIKIFTSGSDKNGGNVATAAEYSLLVPLGAAAGAGSGTASLKQSRRAVRPLIKLVCYMFVCVPFQVMFRDYCLPEFLNLVSSSVTSAKMNVQVNLVFLGYFFLFKILFTLFYIPNIYFIFLKYFLF